MYARQASAIYTIHHGTNRTNPIRVYVRKPLVGFALRVYTCLYTISCVNGPANMSATAPHLHRLVVVVLSPHASHLQHSLCAQIETSFGLLVTHKPSGGLASMLSRTYVCSRDSALFAVMPVRMLYMRSGVRDSWSSDAYALCKEYIRVELHSVQKICELS